MKRSTKPRKSKAERDRDERLNSIYQKREAAMKRAESRMSRAFSAWQKARAQLASIVRTIEKPPEPPLGKGPGVEEIMDDAHKLGIL